MPGSGDLLIGTVYTLLVVISGLVLSKMDKQRENRGSLALRYHLIGAIVSTMAALTFWVALAHFGWHYVAWVVVVGWGSFAVHWVKSRKHPKGIDRQKAFM